MCLSIKSNGEQCKLSPKKDVCHMHQKIHPQVVVNKVILNDSNLKKEIKNLNNTITKKNITIKDIKLKNDQLQTKLAKLQNNNDEMIKDYEKYQIIKRYHYIKTEMLKLWPPQCPYSIIRDINNKDELEIIFEMDYKYILQYYYDLRKQRTSLAHCC